MDGGVFGRYGHDIITSADGEQSGSWYCIKAINNTDLVLTTATSINNYPALDGITVPSADTVPVELRVIEVSSGTCLAYRNKP